VRVASRFLVFTVVALLGGAGVAYAPVHTCIVAGIAFVFVLWRSLRRDVRTYRVGPEPTGDAQKGSKPRSDLTTKLVSGFLLLWWLASISPIVGYSPRDNTGAAEGAVSGSLQYQVLLVAFGCVGAIFLPRAVKGLDPVFRWIAVLWGLHVSWMFLSLLWSIYPPLTFRNAVAFVLVSVGSFGLGAGFYGKLPNGRDLFLRHVFTAGVLSALVLLLPLPLHWQEYALLDPSQRLAIGGNFPAFVVSPAIYALLVLIGTTILGMHNWRKRDWLWVVLLVLPLLALKSRGPVLFAAIALVVFCLLYQASARSRVLQASSLFVIGFGAFVYYTEGLYAFLVPYLSRGNVESTMSLTGRIPLWEVLFSEVQEHPWLGTGFAAFWNPQNYPQMEQLVGFPVVSGHNGFLDILVNVGIVGLIILLAFCSCTLVVALVRARRHDPMGWVTFLFLTFYVLQNLTSSIFTEFYEISLIVLLAALGLMSGGPPTRRLKARSRAPKEVRRPAPSLR
jgi:O-antigen ligase